MMMLDMIKGLIAGSSLTAASCCVDSLSSPKALMNVKLLSGNITDLDKQCF